MQMVSVLYHIAMQTQEAGSLDPDTYYFSLIPTLCHTPSKNPTSISKPTCKGISNLAIAFPLLGLSSTKLFRQL